MMHTLGNGKQRGVGVLDALLLVGSLGLVAWGGIYLGHYGGRFDGNEFEAIPSKRVNATGPAGPPESPEVKRGRFVYTTYCQACHNARGEGEGTPGVPPLDKSEWVTNASPSRLIRILAQAVEGPIKVAGKDYNNPGMVPWATQLPAEDLAAVGTYIRQAWSNKAPGVSVDQIKAVLAETKGRDAKWTVGELEKVQDAAAPELTLKQLHDKLKALPPDKLKDLLKDLVK